MRRPQFVLSHATIARTSVLLLLLTLYLTPLASAQGKSVREQSFAVLTEEYAEALLYIENEDDLHQRLEDLLAAAGEFRRTEQSPEAIYLLGRITYGYSLTQGVFGIRRGMNEARDLIELALAMDEDLLGGVPKALLGYLYIGLPGWPLSFGDKEKGRQLLEEAMALDNQSLGNNYFYASRFIAAKDFPAALSQLEYARSLALPDSPMPKFQTLLLREIDSDHAEIEQYLAEQKR